LHSSKQSVSTNGQQKLKEVKQQRKELAQIQIETTIDVEYEKRKVMKLQNT
jgi:hypothetical protein